MRRPVGRQTSREEAERNVAAFKGVKNKVVDKISDLMSYPARRNAQKAMLKADKQVEQIKKARNDKKSLQEEALKNFKPPNMKGFKYGVTTGR